VNFDVPASVAGVVARVGTFIDERVIPLEPRLHDPATARVLLPELHAQAKEDGLWALGHPAEIGGGGMPFADYVYVNEVQGRSEYGQFALGTLSLQDSLLLHRHATPQVRDRYLRPLVDAEITPAFAMTEPGLSSSDPTQIATSARLDGDEWVLSGRKWFVTGAREAAYVTVMCRTEGPETPPHKAFSLIVVPAGTPGFRVVREIPVLGLHHGHYELAFEDVRVPAAHLVGPRGGGFRVAQERLGPGRIFHAMRWLGQARRAFELMIARLNERSAFGSALADKQLLQRHVFESYAQITASRLLTLDAARQLDAGEEARVAIGMLKVVGARMLGDVVDRAVQVFGAEGLSDDTPLGFMYRTARFARIYDGPDEVHIQSVAKALLRQGI
jgi:acyl-CoA dehydrogenase